MDSQYQLNLKNDINTLRNNLHCLLNNCDGDISKVLEVSRELDIVINKFYKSTDSKSKPA